jgi:hypothetical protein
MTDNLTLNPRGGYRFLAGIEPYSSGVVAEQGWEIVHVTVMRPLPWHDGLVAIRQHLETTGRDRHALCGVELRCPEPHSMSDFIAFNVQYRAVLEDWNMLVDGVNPLARTNVSPVADALSESMLYGFSFTQPSNIERPTFVVAGGGEIQGSLQTKNIVRLGEIDDDAIMEKARCVVDIMCERLAALGHNDLLTQLDVYTMHNPSNALAEAIIPRLPAAAHLGIHWYYTRPPVQDIEFEMDMRGVVKELVIDLP